MDMHAIDATRKRLPEVIARLYADALAAARSVAGPNAPEPVNRLWRTLLEVGDFLEHSYQITGVDAAEAGKAIADGAILTSSTTAGDGGSNLFGAVAAAVAAGERADIT